MTLSVGLSVNPQDPRWLELALEAERAGVDSIWVPEFWAYDAFAPLAAIAARTQRVRLATGIAQLGARTRQVRRTRETVEIIRMITAGERLSYAGEVYQLPLPGGEGVAIRSRAEPAYVPIYIACSSARSGRRSEPGGRCRTWTWWSR